MRVCISQSLRSLENQHCRRVFRSTMGSAQSQPIAACSQAKAAEPWKRAHRSQRPGGGAARCSAAAMPLDTQQRQGTQAAGSARKLTYVSYEANSWQATFEQTGVTVLVDPWLVGELTFGGLPFIYAGLKKGTKLDPAAIAAGADFMLLTQGLPDHAHLPTLEVLPRDMHVVANPAAAKIVQGLGYSNVTVLEHGQSASVADGRLTVTAVEGALVGPPWEKRQNAYLLQEADRGVSMFYEPHCDFKAETLQEHVPKHIDILVTPVTNQNLISYPLVMGNDRAVELTRLLAPAVVLPLMNAEIESTGPLAALIQEVGSIDEFRRKLQEAGLADTRVQLAAPPNKPLTMQL